MFFRRSSEKTSHDPPPGLLAVPLTERVAVGALVAMPTLPALVTIMRSTFTVKNRNDGLGATALASGRTLKKAAPRPMLAPAYPKFNAGPAEGSGPKPPNASA